MPNSKGGLSLFWSIWKAAHWRYAIYLSYLLKNEKRGRNIYRMASGKYIKKQGKTQNILVGYEALEIPTNHL